MGVHRLNHAVLYVRDVARSVEFYGATLGFRPIEGMDQMSPSSKLFRGANPPPMLSGALRASLQSAHC